VPLTDADIERYARQIVIPGFGAAGQEVVCASALLIDGEAEGAIHARAYARAAGFRFANGAHDPDLRCAVLAGTNGVARAAVDALARLSCPVVWYAVDGSRVRAGVWRTGGAHRSRPPFEALPDAPAAPHFVHALAAADAIATAVALAAGWPHADTPYEIELA
jgi:hypothetical protein